MDWGFIGILRLGVKTLSKLSMRGGAFLDITDVALGPVSGRAYVPAGHEIGPPIVFFHGGGFLACDLDTHDWLCSRLAEKSGLPVISVSYRLAPEHPAPIQLEDALAACRYVLNMNGASGKIIVSGDSAGGYLAARCALELNAATKQVIGQILFYPLCDLSDLGDGPITSVAKRLIRQCIGPASYAALRSLELSKLPPGLVIVGGAFDPVRNSTKAFAEAGRSVNVATEVTILPRLFHGALNMPMISKAAVLAVDVGAAAAIRFSQEVLG